MSTPHRSMPRGTDVMPAFRTLWSMEPMIPLEGAEGPRPTVRC